VAPHIAPPAGDHQLSPRGEASGVAKNVVLAIVIVTIVVTLAAIVFHLH